jgi:hypothetical protein
MATMAGPFRKTDDILEVVTCELPMPAATRARPGSLEKIAVMRRRWELGEGLHHPDDERMALHHMPHARPLHISASLAKNSYGEEVFPWTSAG